MPRKRQTQSGAPAQPVSPVGGQMYGAGVEQTALQQAMPAPQLINDGQEPAPGRAPTGTAVVSSAYNGAEMGTDTIGASQQDSMSGADKFAEVIRRAQQLTGQAGMLTKPTGRPGEPVTAGLSRGPGAGPGQLGAQFGNPTGETLRKLSQLRGNPYFAELARRAGI